jgi:hypothetical protein
LLKTASDMVATAARLAGITYFTGNAGGTGITTLAFTAGGEAVQPCQGCNHPKDAHQDWRWQDEIGGLVFRPSCRMGNCNCYGFVPST